MKRATPKLFKRYSRIVSVVLVAWLSTGPVGSIQAKSRKPENQIVIRVAVYNDATVEGAELHDAEHQAAALFAEAGVKIVWLDYSHKQRSVRCQPENSGVDFLLRILLAFANTPLTSGTEAIGRSIIPLATDGPAPCGMSSVFYDRVMAFASPWATHSREILGDAIAHELGHLMLGPQHSQQGIMKAFWTFQDLDLARRGKLQFSPAQLTLLQSAARSLRRDPGMMAAQREIRESE
ncbi:MAG TPA: hypothetical protein VNM47_03865 [Terriglobia bacterium]|nr:hypothetical protein [Terriglobia bacterium]